MGKCEDSAAQRELTAYHEAGHAVAAYRFHHDYDAITIKRAEGTLGTTLTEAEMGRWKHRP